MIGASTEQVTDVVGIALVVVMVGLFAAVDLLPEGRLARRVTGMAAGTVFVVLMGIIAFRFAVLAQ